MNRIPCDGRAISRIRYWKLYRRIGTSFGKGNGFTTFNIPDLRTKGHVIYPLSVMDSKTGWIYND